MTTINSHESIYQSVDGIVSIGQDQLIRDALNAALGREDWTLLEVADRGHFICWPDGTEVFFFDEIPLLKFRLLVTEMFGSKLRTHYQYEILY